MEIRNLAASWEVQLGLLILASPLPSRIKTVHSVDGRAPMQGSCHLHCWTVMRGFPCDEAHTGTVSFVWFNLPFPREDRH